MTSDDLPPWFREPVVPDSESDRPFRTAPVVPADGSSAPPTDRRFGRVEPVTSSNQADLTAAPSPAPATPSGRPGPSVVSGALRGRKWILVLVGAAVLLLILGVGVGTTLGGPGATASPPSSSFASDVPPSAASEPPSTPGQPRSSEPAYTLPAGAQECLQVHESKDAEYTRSASGNAHTTCPFAENVRAAYLALAEFVSPVTVSAHSPVTDHTYSMRCVPRARDVRCTGGRDAVVYLIH